MTPRQAVDLLAKAAAKVIAIESINEYNAAVQAIGQLIDEADARAREAEESAKA